MLLSTEKNEIIMAKKGCSTELANLFPGEISVTRVQATSKFFLCCASGDVHSNMSQV